MMINGQSTLCRARDFARACAVGVLLLGIVLISGCGNSADEGGKSASNPTGNSASAAKPANEDVMKNIPGNIPAAQREKIEQSLKK